VLVKSLKRLNIGSIYNYYSIVATICNKTTFSPEKYKSFMFEKQKIHLFCNFTNEKPKEKVGYSGSLKVNVLFCHSLRAITSLLLLD